MYTLTLASFIPFAFLNVDRGYHDDSSEFMSPKYRTTKQYSAEIQPDLRTRLAKFTS